MKNSFAILLIASISFVASLNAQETTKFTAAKHNEYGLVYSLPITKLKITVAATKTTLTAGPYYKYARKYLGITDVITEDDQTWTIDDVSVETFGVADKDNKYLVQFKNGSSPYIILNERGLPLSVNVEPETVVAKEKKPKPATKSILDNNEYASAIPGEVLAAQSTSKRAEMLAQMIYKIRESRTNIITGEADQLPPDGASMKITMTELDRQEKSLMALFTGTKKTESIVRTFEYTPGDEVTNEVLFRVSDFGGLVDKKDLSGEPVYISVKITERGKLPVNEKGETKKLPKGALMYKIPGTARISIKYLGRTLFSEELLIAQYGVDFGLDPSIFSNKKSPSYVIFHPETGALKEVGSSETQK